MGNYSGDNRGGFKPRGRSFGGDRGGFKPRGRSFGNDRGPREMFSATCDNCGKPCEVPFKPTNGKPVYCSDCFEKMGGRDSQPRFDRSERSPRQSFSAPSAAVANPNQYKSDFEALNAKMDRIISLLEAKTETVTEEVKAPKAKRAKKAASEE